MAMFKKWLKLKTAYVQVFKDRFRIYCDENQALFMVDGGFSHPRMLLGDFELAEQILKQQINQQHIFSSIGSYRVIVHPKEMLDGGLSAIEQRAFKELFLSLGFRDAVIWQHQDLCDEELKNFEWND